VSTYTIDIKRRSWFGRLMRFPGLWLNTYRWVGGGFLPRLRATTRLALLVLR